MLQEAIRSSFDNKFRFTTLFVFGMILLWVSLLLLALWLLQAVALTCSPARPVFEEKNLRIRLQFSTAASGCPSIECDWNQAFPDLAHNHGDGKLLLQSAKPLPTARQPINKASYAAVHLRLFIKQTELYLSQVIRNILSEHAFLRIASRNYPLERLSLCFHSSIKSI